MTIELLRFYAEQDLLKLAIVELYFDANYAEIGVGLPFIGVLNSCLRFVWGSL